MPRKHRLEIPNGIYHIATRSVTEKACFENAGDRLDFLELLATVVETSKWLCQSYCLMGNHYHLILQTPEPTLSSGMQMLNGRYAQRFNLRHTGRRGHLFGGRFYSVLIETDSHLLSALRYVARNPVTAGLCTGPAEWRWSSYRATIGLSPAPGFLDVSPVLDLFGLRRHAAQVAFASFVEDTPSLDRCQGDALAGIDGV
jgi:REP element-mobilizing transposase RayT